MKKIIVSIMLFSLILVGCSEGSISEDTSPNGKTAQIVAELVDGDKARDLIENEDAILVDVRTASEYNEHHIEGAELIPLDTILDNAEQRILNKDTKIIVYCRSGRRSSIAAKDLITLGYEHVYDLGGIDSWDK